MLQLPVVLPCKALLPTAVLPDPIVLFAKVRRPNPEFNGPVVLFLIA